MANLASGRKTPVLLFVSELVNSQGSQFETALYALGLRNKMTIGVRICEVSWKIKKGFLPHS